MENNSYYLVQNGEAIETSQDDILAAKLDFDAWGIDWIVVEAVSADDAIALGRDHDSAAFDAMDGPGAAFVQEAIAGRTCPICDAWGTTTLTAPSDSDHPLYREIDAGFTETIDGVICAGCADVEED